MACFLPPQETPERIRIFNAIYGADRKLAFRTCDDSYRVRFHSDFAPVDSALCFQIAGNVSGRLWVALADTSKLAGLDRWLGTLQLDELPEGLAAIVLDAYLAASLEQVGAKVGESLAITDVRRSEELADCGYALPFVLTTEDGQQTRGMLHFDHNWALTITSLISRTPPIFSRAFDELRIPVAIELGRTALTVAQWGQLEVFDVVLLDQSDLLTRNQVTLRFPPTLAIQCLVRDDGLAVTAVLPEETSAAQNRTESPVNCDDVRITVSVHGGQVEATIGQVLELSMGDVLRRCGPDVQTVDIVVSGHVVGKGELVRSGDQLGVRITTLPQDPLRR